MQYEASINVTSGGQIISAWILWHGSHWLNIGSTHADAVIAEKLAEYLNENADSWPTEWNGKPANW